jgi:hypothetical protein
MSALKDFQKKMNELGESVGFDGIEALLSCDDGIIRHRFDPDTAFDWIEKGYNGKPVLGFANLLSGGDGDGPLDDDEVWWHAQQDLEDTENYDPEFCIIELHKSEYGDGWDIVING